MKKLILVIATTATSILVLSSQISAAQSHEVEVIAPLQSYDSPPRRSWPLVFVMQSEVEGDVIPVGEVLRILRLEHTGGLLRGPARLWYHVERSDGTTTWLNTAESASWVVRNAESPHTDAPSAPEAIPAVDVPPQSDPNREPLPNPPRQDP